MSNNIWQKYLNTICSGKCGNCNPTKSNCNSGCDSNCKSSCKNEKKNSETLRDDGCVCRKCNEFQPMVEPDKDDGKCLCWGCAHPLG